MKRFTYSLKNMKFNDLKYKYACFVFSLFINCTELEMAAEYYRLICIVSLSPYETEMTKSAKQKIRAALLDRPETLVALNNLYKASGLEIRLDSGDENVVAEDIIGEKNEKNEIINEKVNYKEDEDDEAEAEFTKMKISK